MKSCFMFGHADCPDDILPSIEKAIENQYTKGIRCFYVGNRGNFDRLAAKAVKQIKQKHTDLQLFLLLAYHPAERRVLLTKGFDGSYYPLCGKIPKPYAILHANRYMVKTCNSLICYVKHFGKTRELLEYAQRWQKKEGIQIENLAEDF